jgi:FkbM family methyltransferase
VVAKPQAPFVSYAQNREDVVLFRALRDVINGFYIDVGAQDPEVDSVTKAFYDRGWRGLNIEPVPVWYARLVAARPRDINLNLAVSTTEGEITLHEVEDTGLSTVHDELARDHRAQGRFTMRTWRVATMPLRRLCQEHQVKEVHFLKIDVEGAEHEVIISIDFGSVRPWIVVVEAVDPITHEPNHGDWEPTLLAAGYEFALFDGLNRFYVAAEHTDLKNRLATPANVLDHFVSAQSPGFKIALPAGFGINLLGQFSSHSGLGNTARQTARALIRAGVPVVCHELASYYQTFGADEDLADLFNVMIDDPAALPYPINLYSIPAIDVPNVMAQVPQLIAKGRFHAAIVWWETTKLHPSWQEALSRFDAVVAYSDFVSGVLANTLPLTPAITGRQPLFLPDEISSNRAAFGLPEDATVFVSSFDPTSDSVRKNPVAAIAAFRQSFASNNRGVRLVFRLNNADSTPMARDAVQALMNAASGDSRIGFILKPMGYREVLSLYASADVFVSLHRAEGLGLGLLEAMRLGIPVIATGWSGNMTFMDQVSGCLVRYRQVPTSGIHACYRPEVIGADAIWADPVIEDAVAWMQYLHAQPEDRRRIGQAGRERAEHHQAEAMRLGWIAELARLWQLRRIMPSVRGKFSYPV